MELVGSDNILIIGGRVYENFPILLWDTMQSCIPVNSFFRHHLLSGDVGSKKSWATIAQALYDFFSFLSVHDLDWRSVDRGDAISLVAAYRDYCLEECSLSRATTRQRLVYICKFYDYALKKNGFVVFRMRSKKNEFRNQRGALRTLIQPPVQRCQTQ